MRRRAVLAAAAAALFATAAAAAPPSASSTDQAVRARLPEDEVIYFLLPDRFDNGDPSNDRGGLSGDRLSTGYDPTAKGFYHGGDLAGLIRRLDYIRDLGASAIWVGPVFRNKPVQGPPGHESASYHGYWITDFTHVDPHLGTDAEFDALVAAAHTRGLKIYMDVVVNHTADVIRYRECPAGSACPYRSRADYPYQRRGGVSGPATNPGFAGDGVRTAANFAWLTDPAYAYTPYVPAGEEHAKTPAWLNDVRLYHNRGDSTFEGESSTMGDFAGLDDVMTENPRVVAGMIDIFGAWVDRGVDGFRIDTARHVDPRFWQAFVPAMLARAKARGVPNFHIFGEVALPDPAVLAEHTRVDKLPAVLDFGFRQAVIDTVAGSKGTDTFERLFAADTLFEGGEATARRLPTFTGNHDNGRIATYIRRAFPQASDAEVLARVELGNALLLTLRGVPTIYSGDEQGFAGSGDDQDAREDMFASRVAGARNEPLLGTRTTLATAHFGEVNPLFRQIATLARLRRSTPALMRGRQEMRASGKTPGLLAISRFDPVTGREVLLVFNTSGARIAGRVEMDVASTRFRSLAGSCAARAAAPGSVAVSLPAFGYAVCAADPTGEPG